MKTVVTAKVGQHEISLETGRMAKQSDGAVLATCGNNMVLVTAVSSRKPSPMDFLPLTVEFQEKFYASGKIPGGYFKREGKGTTEATLTARLIDRQIRPMFPEGYRHEIQVIATVLSSDGAFPLDILACFAASAALHISDIPFNGPTCAMQVGHIDNQFVLNPSRTQLETSRMDMIVAGTQVGILMVEGETQLITEVEALTAIKAAHAAMLPMIAAIDELRAKAGKEKRQFSAPAVDADLTTMARGLLQSPIEAAMKVRDKMTRYQAVDEAKAAATEAMTQKLQSSGLDTDKVSKTVSQCAEDLKYEIAREMILAQGARIDGRSLKDIRPISNEVGVLPRAHGSGLFTRGETQVLGTVTLGTGDDEQMIDSLYGTQKRKFMLHYNFPPFSVGEVGRVGFQSRREIGHGNLAERALKPILPTFVDFPYTIRIVSEVLESNGSSSMGTVCSGVTAMLDAGVPIKANVAGIAMGLIFDGKRTAVLSDILGDEDHLGDMDFKVAGTREGITALQMDIKIDSISFEVMEQALLQAREGRLHILNEMEKVISKPRGDISQYAPRIETIQIKPDKVREVIGSGGKVIRGIIEETGVKINIEQDGSIHISSNDPVQTAKAIQMIHNIIAEAEVGKTYNGKVMKIMDFGAFVEVLPNTTGLLHISEISHDRIKNVSDVLSEGDEIQVKVLDVDRAGRIKLSRKVLLERPEQHS